SYVDPSGFEGAPPASAAGGGGLVLGADGMLCCIDIRGTPREPKADTKESGEQVGAYVPPIDVSTTGSSSGFVAQPATAAPTSWTQHPLVQLEGGFLGGLFLGAVPFAGVAQQVLDATNVLPHGTPEARLGLAVGQIVGGFFATTGGLAGEVLGGMASATGLGALIGVPAMVVSAAVVTGGVGNMAAGIRGLMTTGSGSGPRNGHLAEKTHPKTRVPFDDKGYPDFKAAGVVKAEVKITLTGTRPGDFTAANRAAGLKETPKGMTWHHHQDGTTMQLVPRGIHEQTGHTGGFSPKGN
ncbi:MAG: HNH endonuclease, partial [Minicystis sp.]